ncbi:MAG: hypothetical protein AAF547_05465 [Actinomycetota bacterium]
MQAVVGVLMIFVAGALATVVVRAWRRPAIQPAEALTGVGALVLGVVVLGGTAGGWWESTSGAAKQDVDGAQARYEAALTVVARSYPEALQNRVSEVLTIEALPPEPFWDVRRPNETGAEYEDRARAAFDGYVDDITAGTDLFPFDQSTYRANERDLVHDPDVSASVSAAFGHLETAHLHFTDPVGLVEQLRALADRTTYTDQERALEAEIIWTDKQLRARQSLLQSLSAAIQVPNLEADPLLVDLASQLDVTLDPDDLGSWPSALFAEMADLSMRLDENIERRVDRPPSEAGTTTIPALSANEHLTEAALNFMLADGQTAASHLRAALDTGDVPDDLTTFVETSLDRVQDPDGYGDAVGLFIIRVDDGRLRAAGVVSDDTIIAIDDTPADDLEQLTQALAKRLGTTITVRRGDETIDLRVDGEGAGGALVTQLVILNGVQI